jgi:NAD(P)-dependent dehydrogenase (short-subunit alcohol dehydrogenase family)
VGLVEVRVDGKVALVTGGSRGIGWYGSTVVVDDGALVQPSGGM